MNEGKRTRVYKCSCGLWARKEYAPTVDGVPTCPRCNVPFRTGYKTIRDVLSAEGQMMYVLGAMVRQSDTGKRTKVGASGGHT